MTEKERLDDLRKLKMKYVLQSITEKLGKSESSNIKNAIVTDNQKQETSFLFVEYWDWNKLPSAIAEEIIFMWKLITLFHKDKISIKS